jgi:hypothetical protein
MHDFLVGGAHELSGVLEAQVKKDPKRFAQLVLRFPDDAHPYYFHAVLRGIADAGVDTDTLLKVCQKCHELPSRPCGSWLCDAVRKAADRELPNELVEMVSWYATEDPDPGQEMWRVDAGSATPYYGGDVFSAGLNCVRGRAALAVAELVARDDHRLPTLRQTLDRLVEDPSIAVRSCVASALTATLIHDRSLAVELFLRLCDTEDVLLGTEPVERFLRYATETHFGELRPILERMLASDNSDVVTAGARQSCLASLMVAEAEPLAERCLSGGETHRVGAAEVFSAFLRTAQYRSVCEESLIALFDDDSDKVRREAARCFFHLREGELGDYPELMEAFVESRAFVTEHWQLLDALERTTATLPAIALLACERFLDVAGEEAADIRTSTAAHTDTVVQIVIRTYNQSKDPTLQTRCLNLFDHMAELGIYEVNRALKRYER